MAHERGAIKFNGLAGRGFEPAHSERSPLWKNALAGLPTATDSIWTRHRGNETRGRTMNFNPAEVLNPIFNALDGLIENDGVYLYLVFVWLALLAIGWIFSGGLRKRMKGNSATVIPADIFTMQPPMQSPPPTIGIEVDQTWNGDDETMDEP
jgi:hypothetical protein